MRLDADLVGGIKMREVQRSHDRDQAGTGSLVATDLQTVASVTIMVGSVHDAGRQPQHALLNGVQNGQVGARSGKPCRGAHHPALLAPAPAPAPGSVAVVPS